MFDLPLWIIVLQYVGLCRDCTVYRISRDLGREYNYVLRLVRGLQSNGLIHVVKVGRSNVVSLTIKGNVLLGSPLSAVEPLPFKR